MRKQLLLIWMLLSYLLSLPILAETEDKAMPTVQTDTIPYVKASLLVASPGNAIYSAFGHCAIRMQCPIFDLDYCYDQKIESHLHNYIGFFMGTARAEVWALPTDEYLQSYRDQGRQVVQYEFNLSPIQKQLMWSYLDELLEKGPYMKYNLVNSNCMSLILHTIKTVSADEKLDMSHQPEELTMINGDLMRFYSQDSPWTQFIYVLAFAYGCDHYYKLHQRLAPNTLVQLLQQATLTDAQAVTRPLLSATPELILPLTSPVAATPFTPTCVFSILLGLIILLSVFEQKYQLNALTNCIDVTLMIIAAIIGTLLFMISSAAGPLTTHWNWYLLLFNPIPLLLWLLLRQRTWYHGIYYGYLAILILFVAITPFTNQLDWTHHLITAIYMVRLTSNLIKHSNLKI